MEKKKKKKKIEKHKKIKFPFKNYERKRYTNVKQNKRG